MRNLKILKAALLAAPIMLFAAPASAQHADHANEMEAEHPEIATPVDPNAVRVNLPEPAETWVDHRVQLEAGRRYAITVSSEVFDPVARLVRTAGAEPIAQDDDSGGGTTSRMVFTAPSSGEHIVQVKSFAPGGSGEFAVSVTPLSPLPALITSGARTERSTWQVYSGNLNANSATEGGAKYADYELRLAEGQIAMLHVLGADGVDTKLQVFTADGRGLSPLVESDDEGGSLNPFILFNPSEAGTYVVRVIGFDESVTGAYRLRISR